MAIPTPGRNRGLLEQREVDAANARADRIRRFNKRADATARAWEHPTIEQQLNDGPIKSLTPDIVGGMILDKPAGWVLGKAAGAVKRAISAATGGSKSPVVTKSVSISPPEVEAIVGSNGPIPVRGARVTLSKDTPIEVIRNLKRVVKSEAANGVRATRDRLSSPAGVEKMRRVAGPENGEELAMYREGIQRPGLDPNPIRVNVRNDGVLGTHAGDDITINMLQDGRLAHSTGSHEGAHYYAALADGVPTDRGVSLFARIYEDVRRNAGLPTRKTAPAFTGDAAPAEYWTASNEGAAQMIAFKNALGIPPEASSITAKEANMLRAKIKETVPAFEMRYFNDMNDEVFAEALNKMPAVLPVGAVGGAIGAREKDGASAVRQAAKGGDTGRGNLETAPTQEQLEEAVEFLDTVLEIGACRNKWEQACVQRVRDVVKASAEAARREEDAYHDGEKAATQEQLDEAVEFLDSMLDSGKCRTMWEHACVQTMRDKLAKKAASGKAKSYEGEDFQEALPGETGDEVHGDLGGGDAGSPYERYLDSARVDFEPSDGRPRMSAVSDSEVRERAELKAAKARVRQNLVDSGQMFSREEIAKAAARSGNAFDKAMALADMTAKNVEELIPVGAATGIMVYGRPATRVGNAKLAKDMLGRKPWSKMTDDERMEMKRRTGYEMGAQGLGVEVEDLTVKKDGAKAIEAARAADPSAPVVVKMGAIANIPPRMKTAFPSIGDTEVELYPDRIKYTEANGIWGAREKLMVTDPETGSRRAATTDDGRIIAGDAAGMQAERVDKGYKLRPGRLALKVGSRTIPEIEATLNHEVDHESHDYSGMDILGDLPLSRLLKVDPPELAKHKYGGNERLKAKNPEGTGYVGTMMADYGTTPSELDAFVTQARHSMTPGERANSLRMGSLMGTSVADEAISVASGRGGAGKGFYDGVSDEAVKYRSGFTSAAEAHRADAGYYLRVLDELKKNGRTDVPIGDGPIVEGGQGAPGNGRTQKRTKTKRAKTRRKSK